MVNVHYLPQLMRAHLARRRRPPEVVISDETAKLLDTGGGIRQRAAASRRRGLLSAQLRFLLDRGARGPTSTGSPAPGTTRRWTCSSCSRRRCAPSAIAAAAISAWTPTGRLTRRPEREVVALRLFRRRHPPSPPLRRRARRRLLAQSPVRQGDRGRAAVRRPHGRPLAPCRHARGDRRGGDVDRR